MDKKRRSQILLSLYASSQLRSAGVLIFQDFSDDAATIFTDIYCDFCFAGRGNMFSIHAVSIISPVLQP